MAIDPVTLGTRLRGARTNRGITQEAAADAIGVPRTAIVQMESGNRSVSTMELARLAEFYGRQISDFFSKSPIPAYEEEDILLALHRTSDAFRDHPEAERKIAQCVDICREGVDLEKLLGNKIKAAPPLYGDFPEPRNVIEAVRQGAAIAAEERKRLGLGDMPIPAIADLISNQGIWAAGADLPDEMSGLFLRHSSIGMVIVVNRNHSRPRRRFSFAHEYAHALMDRNRNAIVSTAENSKDHSETRANAFAAAFLLPEGGVRSFLASLDKGAKIRQAQAVYDVANDNSLEGQIRVPAGSQKIVYQDVASLARHFEVSYQAALYRLQAMDFVNQAEREALMEQVDLGNRYLSVLKFSECTDTAKEGEDSVVDRELVSQVVYNAIEAYRREEISKGRLLDISKKLAIPGHRIRAERLLLIPQYSSISWSLTARTFLLITRIIALFSPTMFGTK
jgi:Zn-dependent peptidase ImmA (M78 family)/transcriptional regulator with XRE-family HTH domain